MKIVRSLAAIMALSGLALGLLFCPTPSMAQNAPLHVVASNAVRTVMEALKPEAEKTVGHPLLITYSTSAAMQKSIEAGEAFDVAVMATDLMDTLAQEGRIAPASRATIARSSVGVGIRANGPKTNISSPEAMKKAILQAKAVTVTAGGASVPFVDKMTDKLGITAQVKAKTIGEPSTTAAAAHVIDGSADMIFTMVSEILPIPGLQLAGPLPKEFDRYLNFGAGTSAKAANPGADAALIKFLSSPAVIPTLKEKGLEPPKR